MGNMIKMITNLEDTVGERLIKILYYFGLAYVVLRTIAAIWLAFSTIKFGFVAALIGIQFAVFYAAMGFIGLRLSAEIALLLYKIIHTHAGKTEPDVAEA